VPRTGLEFDDASVLLHEILGQAQAQDFVQDVSRVLSPVAASLAAAQ